MDADDKSKEPEKETISERLRRIKREADEDINHFDKNGNLIVNLRSNDSALVVREDGTIEMVSHELENHEDGFLGDVEDLNKTFSLVLALASALENEELYNRIFHNLHMSLMTKWNHLSEEVKLEIIERRRNAQINRTEQEREDKQKRINDFRSRMNKYKEQFLDDIEAEKRRLQKDLEDEEEFHKKYGNQFAEEDEEEHFAAPDDIFGQMESRPRKKINKKKKLTLPSKNTIWNPYDESLKIHKGKWRLDSPPDDD
tara:strand:- start:155 stop:925 length:771 start_codon:yes stop_codon:yes gene_type:complete